MKATAKSTSKHSIASLCGILAAACFVLSGCSSTEPSDQQSQQSNAGPFPATSEANEKTSIDATGPCGWLTAGDIRAATGDKVRIANPMTIIPGCAYGTTDNVLNSFISSTPADVGLYESNKSGYTPHEISGLGSKAYCIDIEALGPVPGGSRINALTTNGVLYQIYGTYSCETLTKLAQVAVGRIPS